LLTQHDVFQLDFKDVLLSIQDESFVSDR